MPQTIELAPVMKVAAASRTAAPQAARAPTAPGTTEAVPKGPLRALELTIASRNPAVISVDLFDTLLLRGTEPERIRWLGAASRAAAQLNRHGSKVTPEAIVAARAAATRAGKAMRQALCGPEDVPLETTLAATAEALGLASHAVSIMIEAELAEEMASLTPNRPLLALLARRHAGRRIVVTSDTNLSAAMLAGLLVHFGSPLRFDTIRTSADLGLTKRSGNIFPTIRELERINEKKILHVGDDPLADVEMPSRHGIAPFHLKCAASTRLVRRARKFATKVIHGER